MPEMSEEKVAAVEGSSLAQINDIDIDDVIDYVHKDLKRLPGYLDLYRRYLRQRWDVYDIDFARDVRDWTESMTQEERDAFVAISSGFHHGERQVEVELPVFMLGGSFDARTGIFHLKYTASGGTAPTVISVPTAIHYPNGYQVKIKGGAVVTSAPGAQELTVTAPAGAKVNLQVRTTNAAVVAFYEALGYTVEERVSMGKRLPIVRSTDAGAEPLPGNRI